MPLTISSNKNWSDYEATSSTSLVITNNALTALALTISTGKAYTAGDDIALVPTAAKIPFMLIGTVTSYNSTTGALVANCTRIESQIPSWDLVSASTNTIGTGAKTFITYNGKSAQIAAADEIMVGRRGTNGGNRFYGTVTSYNNADGTLVMNCTSTIGTGTNITDWIIVSAGTFSLWKIVPSPTTNISLSTTANLTFDMQPSYDVGSFISLDRGRFIFNNTSTTTPWVIEFANRATNLSKLFQLENNGRLDVTGAAITVMTGNGAANQTLDFSVATYAQIDHPAIEVETGSGTGVYRPWYVLESSATDRGFIGKNFVSRGYKNYFTPATSATVTLTTASPTVITWTGHGLRPGNRVRFTTTGTYTGITTGTDYYVMLAGFTANTFQIGTQAHIATPVNVTAQSGTHTCFSVAEFGTGLHGNVVLWNPTTRILTFGNGTQGNVVPTGAKVRIPNIHFTCEYPRTPILSAISSATAGNAVTFTAGNTSNIVASAGATFYINQEEFTGTFTGSVMTTATRAINATLAANHAQGDTMYANLAANATSTNNRALFDIADGGIVNLSRCSFGNVILFLSNGQNTNISDVWVSGGCNVGGTTSDIAINGLYSSTYPQSDGIGITVSSILGATSVQNVYSAVTALALNASPSALVLSNLQNATAINNIEGLVTTRNGSGTNTNGTSLSAIIANSIIQNNTAIGGRIFMSNMSRFEMDGIVHSAESSGVISQNVAQAGLSLANCQFAVFRNFSKAVNGAAVRSSIVQTDANCANIVAHSITYDAANNSQAILSPLGNNLIVANGTFGTFPDRGSVTSGSGAAVNTTTGDTATLRNCIFTFGDTYGADNGNGACPRIYLEQTTGHSMWWRAAGNAFDGNYQEMGPFHTLLDNGVKNAGTLTGQFSIKASRDIYDLSGNAYLNNGGSVFLPTTGDSIVLKSYQVLRTITGFTGTVTFEDVNNANLAYSFELVGHEGAFTGTYTALTTANLNSALAAISGYSDYNGFKFRLKITAIADNAANQVINFRAFTTNNAATVLPIGNTVYTLTGLLAGSVIGAFDGSMEVYYTASASGTLTIPLPYTFDGTMKSNAIKVRCLDCKWDDHLASFNQYAFSRGSLQTIDTQVTQTNSATIATYTDLNTIPKIYDYSKYWGMQRANLTVSQVCAKDGTALDFGSYNLVFDATAVVLFSAVGNTITLKSSVISGGTIKTSGTVTYLNGATSIVPITGSNGTNGVITLSVPNGSSVVVYKTDGSRDQYIASSSGTVTSYVPAGVTGSRTYKVTKYGFLPSTGSIAVTGGGYISATVTLVTDSGITQSAVGTVAAYASLNNPDQLYDYSAYNETLTGGIDLARPTTKASSTCSLGSLSLVINSSLGSVFSYSGGTVSIKATVYADGVTFSSTSTSGNVTYLNGATFNTIITSAAGTTGKFTITGLSSHNVYTETDANVQLDYVTGVSSYTLWIPAGVSGAWRWRAVKYGTVPETGTFNVSSGGIITAALANVSDTSISQSNLATVLAYTTLGTWDKVYDYCQAYLTTVNGKTLGQFATKNGSAVDLGSYNLIVDSAASMVFSLTMVITIKATAVNAGSLFAGTLTNGTVTTAGAAVVNTWYTSGAGRSVLVLAPNIISGSRFQLYNAAGSFEIANAVCSAGGIYYRMLWTGDITIRLRVTQQSGATAKAEIESYAVLTSTGVTFLDSQTDEPVYNANGIDGSAIPEFTTDLLNVQIDISDGDGTTSVQRIYAWYHYIITTADGIRNFFRGLEASDTANYTIETAAVNLKLDNLNNSPVIITGGYLFRSDGSTVISATSKSIQMDPGKAYVAPAQVTMAQIEASSVLAKESTVASRLAATSYTAPDNASITTIKNTTNQFVFAGGRVNAVIDASLLAKTADVITAQSTIVSEINANEVKIDTAITNIGTRASQTSVNSIPTNPLLTNDNRLNNLDASVASRLPTTGYTVPPTTTAIVTAVEGSVVLAKQVTLNSIKTKTDYIPANPSTTSDVTTARDAIITATHADAIVINDGVKSASIFVPHDGNV